MNKKQNKAKPQMLRPTTAFRLRRWLYLQKVKYINKPKYLFELIATDIQVSVIAENFNEAKEKLEKDILLPPKKMSKIEIEKITALLPSQLVEAKQLGQKNAHD